MNALWRCHSFSISASSSSNSKPGHARAVRVRALGRVREDAVRVVGGVQRVAVGDVQLGAEVRVELLLVVLDRRQLTVGAGQRGEDRVVGRAGEDLVALRIEQQLGRRVVVLLELEVDRLEQLQHGLGLGLGGRAWAAVGLGRQVGRGTLVVHAPALGEVAVRVDAVVGLAADPVAVVVGHVLAPQPVLGLERVLVAVRVVHADEPQLARVDEPRDLLVGAVVVDEVVERAAARLAREPLARVLHRVVEHGGPRVVARVLRVLA